jgi:glutathione reductase (NADPH)
MRKRLFTPTPQGIRPHDKGGLDLDRAAIVEFTSEEKEYPVESALISGETQGWRAASPGTQTIRLLFDQPQRLRRISLVFEETETLAAVGFSERAAREKSLRFRTHREITNSWYSSRRVGEECSGFKVLIEEKSDQILGAHLLGPHADEIINLFALAIKSGIPASDIRGTIFGYPTLASDIQYML